VRPTRPSDPPRSFLAALHAKYAPEATSTQQQGAGAGTGQQIAISGKVVEEVGFDKIRKQLAQVHALKIVILDGMRVVSVRDGETDSKGVGETCPSIVELDLSRNLFTRMGVVVGVVRELKELRSLRLKYDNVPFYLLLLSLVFDQAPCFHWEFSDCGVLLVVETDSKTSFRMNFFKAPRKFSRV